MSKQLDLSKPLDEETLANLRSRYPADTVQRWEAIAKGSDFTDAEPGAGHGDDLDPEDLKGQALDAELASRGLSKTGTADEKRDRIASDQAEIDGTVAGEALDQAILRLGLDKGGSADDRRARVKAARAGSGDPLSDPSAAVSTPQSGAVPPPPPPPPV